MSRLTPRLRHGIVITVALLLGLLLMRKTGMSLTDPTTLFCLVLFVALHGFISLGTIAEPVKQVSARPSTRRRTS